VADKGKLRQILVNLISNAIKFTDTGGITVRAESIVDADDHPRLVFEVEDTGVGIAPEEMGELFAQFEQTSSGRSSGTGTGLGLSISREYAHLMGGELVVRSEPDIGSVFAFDIRLELESANTTADGSTDSGIKALADERSEARADTPAAISQPGQPRGDSRQETIPDVVLSRLHDAAVRADFETVMAVIEEVAAYDDGLAAELRILADEYDADRILGRLPALKERAT